MQINTRPPVIGKIMLVPERDIVAVFTKHLVGGQIFSSL